VITKALEVEEAAATSGLKEVIEALGISEQEFGLTHQQLASNPQTAEYVMAAQQGKLSPPSSGKEPKLSKSKSLEVFKVSQDLTSKQMERMKTQKMPD